MLCKSVLACWRQPMSKRPGFSARKECCTVTACYLQLQLMQDGWAPIFKILTLRRWPVSLCHKKCGTCGWCDTNTQKENGKVSYWDKAHSHWDAQGLQVTSSPVPEPPQPLSVASEMKTAASFLAATRCSDQIASRCLPRSQSSAFSSSVSQQEAWIIVWHGMRQHSASTKTLQPCS